MRIYFPLSFSKVRATIPDRVMGVNYFNIPWEFYNRCRGVARACR